MVTGRPMGEVPGTRPGHPDPERVRRLAAQASSEPSAFGELYDIYVDRVHAFAYRMLGSRADAEDITAEAFTRALANLGTFSWQRGGFGAWLMRIARNLCYDLLRRKARATGPLPESDLPDLIGPGPEQAVITGESLQRLRREVDALPDSQREAVLLKYAAGLSNREISEVTGRSPTAVSSLLNRVTAKLRERLAEDDE